MFAPATVPAQLALAHVPAVDAVAHSVVQARIVGARTVQLAVGPVEAGLASADVVALRHVPAESIVLAGRRGTRVVATAIPVVETVVAETMIIGFRSEIPTMSPVPARIVRAQVGKFASVADKPSHACAPSSGFLGHVTYSVVLTLESFRRTRVEFFTPETAVMFRACADDLSALDDLSSAVHASAGNRSVHQHPVCFATSSAAFVPLVPLTPWRNQAAGFATVPVATSAFSFGTEHALVSSIIWNASFVWEAWV